jgi:hypothetical protein
VDIGLGTLTHEFLPLADLKSDADNHYTFAYFRNSIQITDFITMGNSKNVKNILQISMEKSDHAVAGIIGNVLANETTIFDHEDMRFSLS